MHYCTVTESILTNRWVVGYIYIKKKQHTLVAAKGLDFELIEGNEFSGNRS